LKIRYNSKLSKNDWKSAKDILDNLSSNEEAILGDWVQSQKSWLIYSYIDQISKTKEEKDQMIKVVY
jgi:hypothetical protein